MPGKKRVAVRWLEKFTKRDIYTEARLARRKELLTENSYREAFSVQIFSFIVQAMAFS